MGPGNARDAMDPTSSTTSTAGLGTAGLQPAGAPLGNALGKDDFLKLLMAQIQFQDPMSPMADHEFVAQLATFSGLEQQMLANDRLGELQLAQLSTGNAQLAGFIGENVVARGDTMTLGSGPVPPLSVQLDGAAANVTITVRDKAGSIVSTVDAGSRPAGSHDISWPGTGLDGQPLPAGDYTISVEATDAQGEPVTASPLVSGVITGVSFENGFAELLVGSRRIQPADILSVGDAPAPAPSTPTPTPTPTTEPTGGIGG